jgi:hypothetical protein
VKTCSICLHALVLSHSTWWSSVPFIFLQITQFNSLLLNNTPLYICVYFLYLFIGCWSSMLTSNLGQCEFCRSKHECTGFSVVNRLTFHQIYAQEWCGRITYPSGSAESLWLVECKVCYWSLYKAHDWKWNLRCDCANYNASFACYTHSFDGRIYPRKHGKKLKWLNNLFHCVLSIAVKVLENM